MQFKFVKYNLKALVCFNDPVIFVTLERETVKGHI